MHSLDSALFSDHRSQHSVVSADNLFGRMKPMIARPTCRMVGAKMKNVLSDAGLAFRLLSCPPMNAMRILMLACRPQL